MTDTSVQGTKAPLGVGEIISNSFSILFGNFGKVLILGFLGAFVGFVVNALFLGFGVATGTADPDLSNTTGFAFGTIISSLINMAIYGLVTALLIQLAYDAKLGRSNGFGAYFRTALPAIVPIAILSIVVAILTGIGAIALLVGALWVYAVFYVMAPVAVIEKGGFGSLGRSAKLTKEYRWPIVGLFIVVIILSIIMQFISGFIVVFLIGILPGTAGPILGGIGMSLITGLGYAFGGIVVALVYARLREIKEGIDVDQIAAVFE